MQKYPAYLTKGFAPYDPIELWRLTEEKVCQGNARKYTDFYCVGVYGGISTGYTVGCCLRCVFCWVDFSRLWRNSAAISPTSTAISTRPKKWPAA